MSPEKGNLPTLSRHGKNPRMAVLSAMMPPPHCTIEAAEARGRTRPPEQNGLAWANRLRGPADWPFQAGACRSGKTACPIGSGHGEIASLDDVRRPFPTRPRRRTRCLEGGASKAMAGGHHTAAACFELMRRSVTARSERPGVARLARLWERTSRATCGSAMLLPSADQRFSGGRIALLAHVLPQSPSLAIR